tara:strand:- start:1881 stop:2165 length:285 start_codon:yes stop_codon:yes gene_type:complete
MSDMQKPNVKDLRACSQMCLKLDVSCPKENSDCRYWIDHEGDSNCTFVAIHNNNGNPMSLREVSERLGVSHVWVSQIEKKMVNKLKKQFKDYAL